HGTSFDYWGFCYANDGTGGRSYHVRPEGKGFKMHTLLKKEFRPVAANAIMSSDHFPEDMQQDFLICNTIGFLGIKQYDLDLDGDGGKRKFGEVWGTPVKEILNSGDRNVRPTDAVIGEDGALYIADWHNIIIGHMQHNIRDPNRDHNHGRIFRLSVKGRPLQKPVKIHGQPIAALLENLKHRVNGVRHRTRVELSGRDSKKVIAAAQAWAKDFDPDDEEEAHHLLEALWLHQQHNVKNEALLKKLLASKVKLAAHAAKTVEHFWKNVDVKGSRGFVADAEVEVVKYEVPKHLNTADQKVYAIGAEIYQRESHCATCHQTDGNGLGNTYPTLIGSPWINGSEDRLVKLALHGLWGKLTIKGKTFDPALGTPPMTAFRTLLDDSEMAAVLTFVRNTWGNRASPIRPATVKRIRAATTKRDTFWKPDELLSEHPLEAALVLKDVGVDPEGFSNKKLEDELLGVDPAKLAEIAKKNGNAERGKNLFYKSSAGCFACHDPPKGTIRLGPDLKTIQTKITDAELVDSILRPSKRIDKSFAQVEIVTQQGKVLTGIRTEETDKEITLRNLAAPKPIKIAKSKILGIEDSKTSVMPGGLVKQLKSRAEFDDLVKFILETRKR
ncbi:MAG: c-type cytochrome, partial [Planctomycetota bacterium]